MMKTNKPGGKVPKLHSFLLADHVYKDALMGKSIICGTYNQLWTSEFPSKLGRATNAYMRLTDFVGTLNIQLRYVDLSNNNILLESPSVTIGKIKDRLKVQEVIMEVPPLPMPHAGQYAMDVYCNEELIGNIRINVSKMPEMEEKS